MIQYARAQSPCPQPRTRRHKHTAALACAALQAPSDSPQGLPVLMTNCRLVTFPARNASATAMFVSLASSNAESLLLSNQNLLRVEIMAKRQERTRAASMEITPPDSFSLIQVSAHTRNQLEASPVRPTSRRHSQQLLYLRSANPCCSTSTSPASLAPSTCHSISTPPISPTHLGAQSCGIGRRAQTRGACRSGVCDLG